MNEGKKEKLNKAINKMLESEYSPNRFESIYAHKVWDALSTRTVAYNILQSKWSKHGKI
jgi:hypothetical protein